jgi:hypothetical protein
VPLGAGGDKQRRSSARMPTKGGCRQLDTLERICASICCTNHSGVGDGMACGACRDRRMRCNSLLLTGTGRTAERYSAPIGTSTPKLYQSQVLGASNATSLHGTSETATEARV